MKQASKHRASAACCHRAPCHVNEVHFGTTLFVITGKTSLATEFHAKLSRRTTVSLTTFSTLVDDFSLRYQVHIVNRYIYIYVETPHRYSQMYIIVIEQDCHR